MSMSSYVPYSRPLKIPPIILQFVNAEKYGNYTKDSKISKSQLITYFWTYAKTHKLDDMNYSQHKREIVLDAKLKLLFNTSNDKIQFYNVLSGLSYLFKPSELEMMEIKLGNLKEQRVKIKLQYDRASDKLDDIDTDIFALEKKMDNVVSNDEHQSNGPQPL